MKLSIVLTVYNKAPYLKRALDSLLNMNNVCNDDYEVLAVNDGSTDESGHILEEYSGRDSRLRIITQNNQGLSVARNNGIDAATGEYVWFVDADDVFNPNSVTLICNSMQGMPDVMPIYACTEGVEKVRNNIPLNVKTGRDILLSRKWEQCGVFWVCRRGYLKEKGLRFMPGIFHEDAEFTPRMLYCANRVTVIPQVLYTVIHEPNSITGKPRPKRAFDCLIVAEKLSTFIKNNNESRSDVGCVLYDSASLMINNGLSIIIQNPQEEQKKFNHYFNLNKRILCTILRNSTNRKYRIESFFLSLFPRNSVKVYSIMKMF